MTIPTATSPLAAAAADPPLTLRGEARFWRVSLALFIGGFATFALLYCVQPMLPAFAPTWPALIGLRALAGLALLVALRLKRVPPPAHWRS
jgi:MFS transporter, YNFM family, putative membrane transport protein